LLSGSCWASPCPDRYTDPIRDAAETYLPEVDWRLYRAQLCAESRLDPKAESSVGAKGIAQFMPATWDWIAPAVNAGAASPYQVRPAAQAGAYYMAQLRRRWSSPRPEMDRHNLAMASYNAGFGNLLKAQRKADMAVLYKPIAQKLHLVTGKHAEETRTYIRRILRFYAWMLTGR